MPPHGQTPHPEVKSSEHLVQATIDKEVTAEASNMPSCGQTPLPEVKSSSRSGYMVDDGVAYFPIMSEDEVLAISVPASAPAHQVRSTLAEHGVCLVTGVLDQCECCHLEELWKTDLVGILGASRLDENQDSVKRLHIQGARAWPERWSHVIGKKGVASQRGLPHGSFAWNCRMHTGVRKVFADIFEVPTDELAVGLDCVFWSSADAPAAESNPEWLHCDQNHRSGLTWPCVQGVLYVWSSEDERASTTVIWPGSHQGVYQRIMQDPTAVKRGRHIGGQSVRLSQLTSDYLRQQLIDEAMAASRRVPCPAGSLLLWDSRTIHQGWAGGPRLAQPVCWEPRERREGDQDALGRKISMCVAGVPSSHSSAEARVHGMAPRSKPCDVIEGYDMPAIKAHVRPFCVAEDKKREWEAAQKSLWKGGAVGQADSSALIKLLKLEILDAL